MLPIRPHLIESVQQIDNNRNKILEKNKVTFICTDRKRQLFLTVRPITRGEAEGAEGAVRYSSLVYSGGPSCHYYMAHGEWGYRLCMGAQKFQDTTLHPTQT